jgi:SAM-dependent methyltransferase
MIRLDAYHLSAADRAAVSALVVRTGLDPSLEQIWAEMDRAWEECGCSAAHYDEARYAAFYAHPVWLLNGIFIEQDELSLQHRRAITEYVVRSGARRIVDFGGGFGTLARMIAERSPGAQLEIFDPYPPQHGVISCRGFPNISFVPRLTAERYDCLVCTDVLEHLHDPLQVLAQMVDSVRPGGRLLIANHFYPVIGCHIPSTFHLRHSFDRFCELMGLRSVGPCEGSHATIYERVALVSPDWPTLRRMERRSRALLPAREWRVRWLSQWERRLLQALRHPLYYPTKAWRRMTGRVE